MCIVDTGYRVLVDVMISYIRSILMCQSLAFFVIFMCDCRYML